MTNLMCNCEDFTANIELLTGDVLIFGYKREYKGKPLVFCPWCGKRLKSVKLTTGQEFVFPFTNESTAAPSAVVPTPYPSFAGYTTSIPLPYRKENYTNAS